jgi:cytochrome c553
MTRDSQRRLFDAFACTFGLAVSAMLVVDAVASDRQSMPVANQAWQSECGGCHVAFAPRLLPASSWRIIMRDLDRHFGVDASVDRDTAASIGAFLEANAGRDGGKRVDASALRITEAGWFRREHAGIAASTWARSDVGSAANCGACHRDAGRGDFNERAVRVPR